jgi:hypothetical protein
MRICYKSEKEFKSLNYGRLGTTVAELLPIFNLEVQH